MKKMLALLLCLLVATSCASFAGADELNGTVTMWTFLDPVGGTDARSRVLASIIEDFTAKNPGVKIVVEPQSFDLLVSKFLAANSTGTAPDICWILLDDVPACINAGAMEPLEKTLLSDWTAEEIADIDNNVFNYYSNEDAHYVVGMSSNAFVLFYRADLFEKYGIEPSFDSWEEFIEAAKKLNGITDPVSGQVMSALGLGLSPTEADPCILHSYLAALVGDVLNEDGTANWDNDGGLEALKFQNSLIFEHGIVPETCLNYTVSDAITSMISGKFAMIVAHNTRMSQIRGAITVCAPGDIQIMEYPKTNDKYTPACVGGWTLSIWSGSKNKEAASAFLEALISPEADEKWVKEALQNPIRKSTILNNPEYFATEENAFVNVVLNMINNGYIPESKAGTNVTGWIDDLAKAAENYAYGMMTAEEALKEAAENFNDRNVG